MLHALSPLTWLDKPLVKVIRNDIPLVLQLHWHQVVPVCLEYPLDRGHLTGLLHRDLQQHPTERETSN